MNPQPKQIVEHLQHLTATDVSMTKEHYERILETFKTFVAEMDKLITDKEKPYSQP